MGLYIISVFLLNAFILRVFIVIIINYYNNNKNEVITMPAFFSRPNHAHHFPYHKKTRDIHETKKELPTLKDESDPVPTFCWINRSRAV